MVNNVGAIWKGWFKDQTFESIRDLAAINVGSQLVMTRVLLPHMLKTSQKTAIINISSIAIYGTPFVSVYSATKSFNNTFNNALAC